MQATIRIYSALGRLCVSASMRLDEQSQWVHCGEAWVPLDRSGVEDPDAALLTIADALTTMAYVHGGHLTPAEADAIVL